MVVFELLLLHLLKKGIVSKMLDLKLKLSCSKLIWSRCKIINHSKLQFPRMVFDDKLQIRSFSESISQDYQCCSIREHGKNEFDAFPIKMPSM